jgi:hypothetical protein
MQTLKRYIFLLFVVFVSVARAELVKVKGKGEIIYKANVLKLGQNSTEERAAITEAKKNALARFVAEFDSARFELYKKVESVVLADIDQFVTDYTQLDQQVDKTSKRYTVVIEASINATLIENTINKTASTAVIVENGGSASTKAGGNFFTFVFVARELASRKEFDAKRTAVVINEKSDVGAQEAKVSEDGQSAKSSLENVSVDKKTTGGNVEIKANELSYRVSTVTEVDNAVNSVLTKARYEVVDPVDAGLNVDNFRNDFSGGNDVSAATRTAAIKTCREKEIGYIAIANMDVGLPEKDEATGMIRVYVAVTAKVSDLSPKFPKTVASIAGKPYAGLGPNPQVAKQNALNEAAARSATELVDQLRIKGVK